MTAQDGERVRSLTEVRERLCSASDSVNGLMDKAAASHATSEFSRLCGKREGIHLAVAYVDDALRDALANGGTEPREQEG